MAVVQRMLDEGTFEALFGCAPRDQERAGLAVIQFLQGRGIRIRQDDGSPVQINISVSEKRDGVVIVGLRYVKRDATFTEDHFVLRITSMNEVESVTAHYRGRLEYRFLEYMNT